jgi:16S rRNA processing protein RimM
VNDLIKIGKLTRLHGIKGSVVLHIQGLLVPDLKKIKSFFIEINQTPTPFFVTEIKASGKNLIISFDSVKTIETAQKIINCEVWLEEKNLKKEIPVKDLTGYILNDKNAGDLGLINEVIDMPGQKMFSITIKDQEVLLPFTEDLIAKIDHKIKTVFYKAPEGLIEIYTS